jgi:hypothetical protein
VISFADDEFYSWNEDIFDKGQVFWIMICYCKQHALEDCEQYILQSAFVHGGMMVGASQAQPFRE